MTITRAQDRLGGPASFLEKGKYPTLKHLGEVGETPSFPKHTQRTEIWLFYLGICATTT